MRLRLKRNARSQDPVSDPVEFWKAVTAAKGIAQLELVERAARMLLAVPATSAPSERIFSSSGFFDRRARGRSNILGTLAYVKKNCRMLGCSPRQQVRRIAELLVAEGSEESDDDEEDEVNDMD
jgi:hypothetical protein